MSCRCSDILNCRMDITTIGDMIDYIGNSQSKESDISDSYMDLKSYSDQSFIVDDMIALTNKEKDLNKDMLEKIPNISTKCSNEITSLSYQLSGMESEDRSYHEELARQAREREEESEKK